MKSGIKTLAMWLIIGIIFLVVVTTLVDNSGKKMSYSELINRINNAEVQEIELSADGGKAYVLLKDSSISKEVNIPSIDSFMEYVQARLETGEITLTEKSQSIFITILSLFSPFAILIIFLIFWLLIMNNGQSGNKTMSFGKSRARLMQTADKNRITFEDVAGVDEEKEELQEIVEFLKSPKKFTDMGARIPKGVLLVGQPGTGKHYLQKL